MLKKKSKSSHFDPKHFIQNFLKDFKPKIDTILSFLKIVFNFKLFSNLNK